MKTVDEVAQEIVRRVRRNLIAKDIKANAVVWTPENSGMTLEECVKANEALLKLAISRTTFTGQFR